LAGGRTKTGAAWASLDVGSNALTGVNDADYRPSFKFNGKIHKITRSIDRPKLTPEDIRKLQEVMKKAADVKD
jgi:arylsulfatase